MEHNGVYHKNRRARLRLAQINGGFVRPMVLAGSFQHTPINAVHHVVLYTRWECAMKIVVLLFGLAACQTTSEPPPAPAPVDAVQQDVTPPPLTVSPTPAPETQEQAPPVNPAPSVQQPSKKTSPPAREKTPVDASRGEPAAEVMVGYDRNGQKGSLPNLCATCRRMPNKTESEFINACRSQGGVVKMCGCFDILCSVVVK